MLPVNTNRPLEDTIDAMRSDDYKDRFIAEYYQVRIRYERLKKMVENWDSGNLTFQPTCPRSIYDMQLNAMKDYIALLEARAAIEEVNLDSL